MVVLQKLPVKLSPLDISFKIGPLGIVAKPISQEGKMTTANECTLLSMVYHEVTAAVNVTKVGKKHKGLVVVWGHSKPGIKGEPMLKRTIES